MNKLLRHFETMQGKALEYLKPGPYCALHDAASAAENDPSAQTYLFAHDMLECLDGPEQREAEAEARFDYVAECDVTASGMWNPEQCDAESFVSALGEFVRAAQKLDKFKKVLFRGRTALEAGTPVVRPEDRSLDAFVAPENADLVHGIVGVATESGEAAEVLYHYLRDNKPFDRVNVREEIGDVLWYVSRLVRWADTTFEGEMRRNIQKLRNRHGAGGFNKDRDVNRNLANERALLESESQPVQRPSLEKGVQNLRQQVEIARSPGNADVNEYMRGMANGLICALSNFTGLEPEYVEAPAQPVGVVTALPGKPVQQIEQGALAAMLGIGPGRYTIDVSPEGEVTMKHEPHDDAFKSREIVPLEFTPETADQVERAAGPRDHVGLPYGHTVSRRNEDEIAARKAANAAATGSVPSRASFLPGQPLNYAKDERRPPKED